MFGIWSEDKWGTKHFPPFCTNLLCFATAIGPVMSDLIAGVAVAISINSLASNSVIVSASGSSLPPKKFQCGLARGNARRIGLDRLNPRRPRRGLLVLCRPIRPTSLQTATPIAIYWSSIILYRTKESAVMSRRGTLSARPQGVSNA